MNVLIGFEESQAICIAFRKRGHNAFSCDTEKCSGGHPEWHLQMDIFKALYLMKWDLIILHPPCTYKALCGNRWYWNSPLRFEGIFLCKSSWNDARAVCDKVVLEQPKTIMQRWIGKKSQVIHPWQHGHLEVKETWLWIEGVPLLKETDNVYEEMMKLEYKDRAKTHYCSPNPERGKKRSKTYLGVTEAFAEQWG